MKTWYDMVSFAYTAQKKKEPLVSRLNDAGGNMPYGGVLQDLMKAKVFEIDDTVKRMLLMTKEPELSFEELKLPFTPMYLDVTILPEDMNIGKEMNSIEGLLISPSQWEDKEKKISMNFFAVMNLTRGDEMIFLNKTTITTRMNMGNFKVKHQMQNKKEYAAIKRFIYNFLLFLKQPDVKTVEIVKSEKNILRKLKRGKVPEPNKVLIKIGGRIKKYVDSVKSMEEFSYSHSFWVRGHWRTLKSKFYKDKIGERLWITPFIKGEGMLVSKTYEVKEGI